MRTFFCIIALAMCALPGAAETIATPARIASYDEVIAHIAGCHNLTLSAYMLEVGSPIVGELERAADRGCRVNVVLDGRAFGFARTANENVIADLERHRIRAVETAQALHLKFLSADGKLYLNDRNWAKSGDSLIIADDDPLDYRIVYAGLVCAQQRSEDDGDGVCPPHGNNHLWVVKRDALAAEAAVIRANESRDVDVESESWGAGTPVYDAVADLAARGYHVRVLVAALEYRESRSESERRSLSALAQRGVAVRIGDATEKIAVNGTCSYVGSANSTRGLSGQIEFGLAFCNPTFAAALAQHFETNWAAGSAVQ